MKMAIFDKPDPKNDPISLKMSYFWPQNGPVLAKTAKSRPWPYPKIAVFELQNSKKTAFLS